MKSGTEPLKPTAKAGLQAHAYNKRWSWVQFVCAFVLVGGLAFLHIDPPLDGLVAHLVKTVVIAGGCGVLAGRFGDSAWHGIVTLLRWF
jgi:hypothetical protein